MSILWSVKTAKFTMLKKYGEYQYVICKLQDSSFVISIRTKKVRGLTLNSTDILCVTISWTIVHHLIFLYSHSNLVLIVRTVQRIEYFLHSRILNALLIVFNILAIQAAVHEI